MGRRMEIDGELFRGVVTCKKMVQNPAYQWSTSYRDRDPNIPSSIPSETETVTTVLGPYRRVGAARSMTTQFMKDGYGQSKNVVGSHIERAIVTWEVLDG
jgi:hypothetical protein